MNTVTCSSVEANSSSSLVHRDRGHHVRVGGHAPLGRAGRARGVDDRGGIRGPDCRGHGIQFGLVDLRAAPAQLVQADRALDGAVEGNNVLQIRAVRANLGQLGHLLVVLAEDHATARVSEDVPALAR